MCVCVCVSIYDICILACYICMYVCLYVCIYICVCVCVYMFTYTYCVGFSDSSVGKESAYNAGDPGSIPGLGRSPGEGKGYPL